RLIGHHRAARDRGPGHRRDPGQAAGRARHRHHRRNPGPGPAGDDRAAAADQPACGRHPRGPRPAPRRLAGRALTACNRGWIAGCSALREDRASDTGQEEGSVASDRGELYEVDTTAPQLDGAPLLWYFDGFIDAGAAGRLLAEHLLENLDHKVVATFDVDRLIDYRSRRPVMIFDKDHWERYDNLELVVHLVHDAAGAPFLLLTGPEP